jgi:hypothetical protein
LINLNRSILPFINQQDESSRQGREHRPANSQSQAAQP